MNRAAWCRAAALLWCLPRLALIGLVRLYQIFLSPALAPSCRYYPSCSQYAIDALREHGAVRGVWMAARRLLRCHPWAMGGLDPVPPRRPRATEPPCPAGRPAR